jgi:hypothetical protein
MGGLTAHQVELAEKIYSRESVDEIARCCHENIGRFSATYDLCSTCLDGSLLQLTPVSSGFHGIAFTVRSTANAVARAREISAELIERHGISSIPVAHFGFPQFSPIGFRVNYSKNPGKLQEALVLLAEIFNKDPHLSD